MGLTDIQVIGELVSCKLVDMSVEVGCCFGPKGSFLAVPSSSVREWDCGMSRKHSQNLDPMLQLRLILAAPNLPMQCKMRCLLAPAVTMGTLFFFVSVVVTLFRAVCWTSLNAMVWRSVVLWSVVNRMIGLIFLVLFLLSMIFVHWQSCQAVKVCLLLRPQQFIGEVFNCFDSVAFSVRLSGKWCAAIQFLDCVKSRFHAKACN